MCTRTGQLCYFLEPGYESLFFWLLIDYTEWLLWPTRWADTIASIPTKYPRRVVVLSQDETNHSCRLILSFGLFILYVPPHLRIPFISSISSTQILLLRWLQKRNKDIFGLPSICHVLFLLQPLQCCSRELMVWKATTLCAARRGKILLNSKQPARRRPTTTAGAAAAALLDTSINNITA